LSSRADAETAGTAVIHGRVVAADTGLPIPRAQVRITQERGTGPGTLIGTDESGRYASGPVAPGRYMITAEKTGYMRAAYGQRQFDDAGHPVTVAAGQTLEGVDVMLLRGGAIVVDVTDDLGEPFARARVALEQHELIFGNVRLSTPITADTDEFGRARISELRAGDYYVLANPHTLRRVALGTNDGERILAPTYHPGSTSVASAMTVRVTAGQEVSVSLRLAAVATVSVSGVAYALSGEPLTGTLGLVHRPRTAQGAYTATIQSGGQFRFTGVVPGTYHISANNRTGLAQAELPIDVSGDVAGVVVRTSTGATVRGRIVFDTGTPPNIPLAQFQMWAAPTWATVRRPGQFTVQDDGRFELAGIFGRSVLRPAPGERTGWFLKSVSLDGKDITDTVLDLTTGEIGPVEVTFTQKQTELTGTILDRRGDPTSDFVAVIFPERPELRTLQTRSIAVGRPDQQGRFTVMGLPPGGYLAATVGVLATNQERDVELLRRLEMGSERLTLAENESKSITLRVAP
jgi:hypothetical protein